MEETLEVYLMKVVELKRNDAYDTALGARNTPAQIEEYKMKYDEALAGNVYSEAENAEIIANHQYFYAFIRNAFKNIEYLRLKIKDNYIAVGEYSKALELINRSYDEITFMSTPEEIDAFVVS